MKLRHVIFGSGIAFLVYFLRTIFDLDTKRRLDLWQIRQRAALMAMQSASSGYIRGYVSEKEMDRAQQRWVEAMEEKP